MAMEPHGEAESKSQFAKETGSYSLPTSHETGTVTTKWQDTFAEIKHAFTTREGWIGDYVYSSSHEQVRALGGEC